MSWAHPFTLAAVPAALVAIWLMFRRGSVSDGTGFLNIRRRWADRHGISDRPAAVRRRWRGVLLAVAVVAALCALARPQWGEITEQSYSRSREVVLALDLSRSMLAEDVGPTRLARAKLLIDALLDQLKGERVGLVVFSGTAFVQSPLSADYEVLRDFLAELDPSYLPEGGTDYAAMLRTAVQAFGEQGDGDRYLVVLSDGEALDPDWQKLVPALRERGIRVIGLGVGTPAGALVPDPRGGVTKDEHGAAVLSRLEPATLQALATETGGTYRDAATWVDIAELVGATVEQGRKGEYVEQRNVRLQDRFQWFLAPALLLALLSLWLEFPVSPLVRALPTRGRRPHPASAPAIAAVLVALAAWHSPRPAFAAVPDAAPPQSGTASQPDPSSQPDPLVATVAALSDKPQLQATDYARLATDTIAFASKPNAPTDASRAAIIDDALAGVDRGARADPRAADWPTLRQQLEQLKEVKKEAPQTQPNQPQQNQAQQNQQERNGQQGQQDQQAGGAGQQQNSQNAGGSAPPNQRGQGDQQKSSGQGDDQPNEAAQASDANRDQQRDNDAAAKDADGKSSRPQNEQEQARNASPGGNDQRGDDEAQKPQDRTQSGGGEVKRQDDVKPRTEHDAGLADQDQGGDKPEGETDVAPPAQQSAKQSAAGADEKPGTRMVGGGRALQSAESPGDTALAEAVGKMERVHEGDAPGVLFERMNQAEGRPRAAKNGKNW